MKLVMRFALSAAVLCGFATLAQADDTVIAKVPFAFVVGTQTLPAGDYLVTRNPSNPEIVSIAQVDGAKTTLVLTRRAASETGNDRPALSFERIGNVAYLTQVTLGPSNSREIQSAPATATADEDAPRR
jgi:hypothetical protein